MLAAVTGQRDTSTRTAQRYVRTSRRYGGNSALSTPRGEHAWRPSSAPPLPRTKSKSQTLTTASSRAEPSLRSIGATAENRVPSTGGQVLSVDHTFAGSGQGSETKRIAGRILESPEGVGVGRRGFLSRPPGQVHRMIRDPSGGGFSLYGAPWWVGVIGVVAALIVIGLARLWWNARLSFLARQVVNRRRRERERTRRNRS